MRILIILPTVLVLIAISCGNTAPTPQTRQTPTEAVAPKARPTPTETTKPSEIFGLWEAMKTINDFLAENERDIKRCLASQDVDYSKLYGDGKLVSVYKEMEDDLNDGQLDEFKLEDVKGSIENLTKVFLGMVAACGIR